MKRKCMPLVLVLATGLVLTSISWFALSKTSQAAPTSSGEDSFKGKVLVVVTAGDRNSFCLIIEKAQTETMGGQSWLVGKGASDKQPSGWYKGRTVRIRMEQIVTITEFNDLKEAHKALAGHLERLPQEDLPAPREPPPPQKEQ